MPEQNPKSPGQLAYETSTRPDAEHVGMPNPVTFQDLSTSVKEEWMNKALAALETQSEPTADEPDAKRHSGGGHSGASHSKKDHKKEPKEEKDS